MARHQGRRSARRPSHVHVRREADRAAGAPESAHRELEALLEVALEAGRQLDPQRFTHPEARLLSLLAAEVAPAIETSHLLAAAQRAARVDALTGLPNRSALTAGIGMEIEEALRRGSSLALMYVDVDDFRSVNDAFGYAAGNEVLREIGARIAGIGPLARAAARFGADEFVVCLPIGSGAGDRAIARAVIELGRAFGLRVVAEGVEEPETLAWLRGLGCPVVQGFLLGRPVSAEDLARLLTRSG